MINIELGLTVTAATNGRCYRCLTGFVRGATITYTGRNFGWTHPACASPENRGKAPLKRKFQE